MSIALEVYSVLLRKQLLGTSFVYIASINEFDKTEKGLYHR